MSKLDRWKDVKRWVGSVTCRFHREEPFFGTHTTSPMGKTVKDETIAGVVTMFGEGSDEGGEWSGDWIVQATKSWVTRGRDSAVDGGTLIMDTSAGQARAIAMLAINIDGSYRLVLGGASGIPGTNYVHEWQKLPPPGFEDGSSIPVHRDVMPPGEHIKKLPARGTAISGSTSKAGWTCEWSLEPAHQCEIEEITFYMDAFIPSSFPVDETKPLPPFHIDTVTKGKNKFKTAFVSTASTMTGTADDRFVGILTDQRGFDPAAKGGRLRAKTSLDVKGGEGPRAVEDGGSVADPWVVLDVDSGETICKIEGDPTSAGFSKVKISQDRRHYEFQFRYDLKGYTACPRGPKSMAIPEVRMKGKVTVNLNEERNRAVVIVRANVNRFPAFEMYVSANDQPPQALFNENIDVKRDPLDRRNPAALRNIESSVTFSC